MSIMQRQGTLQSESLLARSQDYAASSDCFDKAAKDPGCRREVCGGTGNERA